MSRISKRSVSYVNTHSRRSRVLVIDDNVESLQRIAANAIPTADGCYQLNGYKLVLGIYGNQPEAPPHSAMLEFASLSEITDYASNPKNRIKGVITDLYEGMSPEQYKQLNQYYPAAAIEEDLGIEEIDPAYGYPLAMLLRQAGIPVAIHTRHPEISQNYRDNLERAVGYGALGLYNKCAMFGENEQGSALDALKVHFDIQRRKKGQER